MTETDDYSDHISKQFNRDIDSIKNHILAMGGLVEQQLRDAITAWAENDLELADKVREKDKTVNTMELEIDEECTRILARRQPAASDLRLIMVISKMVSDLERIGDESSKIAKQALISWQDSGSVISAKEIRLIGNKVLIMLREVLDAFARLDKHKALEVAKQDKVVDAEYKAAIRTIQQNMQEQPETIASQLTLMLSLRFLERVGDHARNIAEYIIYVVEGVDVRHSGIEAMEDSVFGKFEGS